MTKMDNLDRYIDEIYEEAQEISERDKLAADLDSLNDEQMDALLGGLGIANDPATEKVASAEITGVDFENPEFLAKFAEADSMGRQLAHEQVRAQMDKEAFHPELENFVGDHPYGAQLGAGMAQGAAPVIPGVNFLPGAVAAGKGHRLHGGWEQLKGNLGGGLVGGLGGSLVGSVGGAALGGLAGGGTREGAQAGALLGGTMGGGLGSVIGALRGGAKKIRQLTAERKAREAAPQDEVGGADAPPTPEAPAEAEKSAYSPEAAAALGGGIGTAIPLPFTGPIAAGMSAANAAEGKGTHSENVGLNAGLGSLAGSMLGDSLGYYPGAILGSAGGAALGARLSQMPKSASLNPFVEIANEILEGDDGSPFPGEKIAEEPNPDMIDMNDEHDQKLWNEASPAQRAALNQYGMYPEKGRLGWNHPHLSGALIGGGMGALAGGLGGGLGGGFGGYAAGGSGLKGALTGAGMGAAGMGLAGAGAGALGIGRPMSKAKNLIQQHEAENPPAQ